MVLFICVSRPSLFDLMSFDRIEFNNNINDINYHNHYYILPLMQGLFVMFIITINFVVTIKAMMVAKRSFDT